MATVSYVIDGTSDEGESAGVRFVTWAGLQAGDEGEAFASAAYADRSVQVSGDFGAAKLLVEGSNDGTNWAVLNDPQGNALDIGTARIEAVSELTRLIRPRVSGGTATALNVTLLVKRSGR